MKTYLKKLIIPLEMPRDMRVLAFPTKRLVTRMPIVQRLTALISPRTLPLL